MDNKPSLKPMKNWCKIFEFENKDVLVRKTFDDLESKYEVSIEAYTVEFINVTCSFGFDKEEERDKCFEKIDEAAARKMSDKSISEYLKILE